MTLASEHTSPAAPRLFDTSMAGLWKESLPSSSSFDLVPLCITYTDKTFRTDWESLGLYWDKLGYIRHFTVIRVTSYFEEWGSLGLYTGVYIGICFCMSYNFPLTHFSVQTTFIVQSLFHITSQDNFVNRINSEITSSAWGSCGRADRESALLAERGGVWCVG